jgi:hypothetical protein
VLVEVITGDDDSFRESRLIQNPSRLNTQISKVARVQPDSAQIIPACTQFVTYGDRVANAVERVAVSTKNTHCAGRALA